MICKQELVRDIHMLFRIFLFSFPFIDIFSSDNLRSKEVNRQAVKCAAIVTKKLTFVPRERA